METQIENKDATQEFEEGLNYLSNEYASKAVAHFARAVELESQNPVYLSYLGLAVAAAVQKWDQAEEYCYTALRMKRNQPELYLNLAEVYRLAGKREDAVQTLLEGLPLTKRDARIVKALRKYGMRKPPVLSFLDRSHPVNKKLGRIRYRLMKSVGKEV